LIGQLKLGAFQYRHVRDALVTERRPRTVRIIKRMTIRQAWK
jgi:hypothetical protein